MTTAENQQVAVIKPFDSKTSRLSSTFVMFCFGISLVLMTSGLSAQVQVITFDDEYQDRWLPEGEERVPYTLVSVNIESGATSTDPADYAIEYVLPSGLEAALHLSDPPLVSREFSITGTPESGEAGNWNVKVKVSEYTDSSHTALRAQGTFTTVLEIIEGEHWGPFTFTGESVLSGELAPAFVNRSYQSESVSFEFGGNSAPTEFEVEAPELDTLGLEVVVERNDDSDENWFYVSGFVLPDIEGNYSFIFRVSPVGSNAWGQLTLKLEVLAEPAPIGVSRVLEEGFDKHDGRLITALLNTPYDSNDSFWSGHGLLVRNSMHFTVEGEGVPMGLEIVTTPPAYEGQGSGIQSRLSLAGVPTETGVFEMVVAVIDMDTGDRDEIDVGIQVIGNPSVGDMLFGGPSVGARMFPAARVAETYPPVTFGGNNAHLPQRELDVDTPCYLRVYWADNPNEGVPVGECMITHNLPAGMTVAAQLFAGADNVLRVAGTVASDVAGDYNPRIKLQHAASSRNATLSLPLHVVSRAKILTNSLDSQKEGEERTTYIQYETTDNEYIDLDEDGVILTGLPDGLDWSVNKYNYRIVIDGTPIEGSALTSPYSIFVKLTFDDGSIVATAEKTFALHIEEAEITISLDSPSGFQEGIAIEPVSIDLDEGFEPYSLEVSGLPPGLALEGSSDDGFKIVGAPDLGSSEDSPYLLRFEAEDVDGHFGSLEAELTIVEPLFLPTVILGRDYLYQLTPPDWGTPPYSQNIAGELPPGIEINQAWQIVGTPEEWGTNLEPSYFAILTVEDSEQNTRSVGIQLTLQFYDLTFNTNTLDMAIEGTEYSMPLVIDGGYGEYTVIATNLPGGLTIEFNDDNEIHEIVGTPSFGSARNYLVAFEIYDSAELPDMYLTQLALRVVPASDGSVPGIRILTTNLPPAIEGEVYGPIVLEAEGADSGFYDWSQSIGIPPGLSLSRASNDEWLLGGVPIHGTASEYFVSLVVTGERHSLSYTAASILPVTVFSSNTGPVQTSPPSTGEVRSSLLASGTAAGCSLARSHVPIFWLALLFAGAWGCRCMLCSRGGAGTASTTDG